MLKNLRFDAQKDLKLIGLICYTPHVLVVRSSLSVQSLPDLIKLSKAQPDTLRYGSSGIGSANHMAGELLKLVAKVNIAHVPYKGNAPALTDLIGGHVEILISGVPAVIGQIKNGRVRAIAIASLKRFPALPDTPTIDESGLKGFEATTWFGVMAPRGTPREVVRVVNEKLQSHIDDPKTRAKYVEIGAEPIGGSPESFAERVKADYKLWGQVVRESGIKLE